MKRPDVSILIPCLNEQKTIALAVGDAKKNGRKFFGKNFEVIVADNGSTDSTLTILKKIKGIRLEIWEKEVGGKQVDDKVIKLAKSLHGRILTTDYNLNRVASLSGGQVLNINDLANALKTLAVPGEMIDIKVIHLGKDPKQGVGYFNDGTMIVVEDGGELVGKEVKAEVTRMLQSSAGRMVFAKLHYSQNHKAKTQNLI
jgi:uncharacterized protein YacL